MAHLPPARILGVVEHYLDAQTAGNAKLRDEVNASLDEATEAWRWLTHPDLGDPTSDEWAPSWWDEDEAGRTALSYATRAGPARSV